MGGQEDRRGEDWEQHIKTAMEEASVGILLVSTNSLTSKFILREEVSRLLQRRAQDGLRIFPIIIKPCAWQAVDWLRRMNLRPRDGRPISGGSDYQIDADLAEIAMEICGIIAQAREAPHEEGPVPLPPEKISISRLPVTGKDLFGRDDELKLLDKAWADEKLNVISFVAWGGVGKSALVNRWLRQLGTEDYRGAERVFGWSFYSQGTTERAVSADQFIDTALRWFGDPQPEAGSPWDKGVRLAERVREQRTLLVLDGLEPLQYPPGPQEGLLKDQGLQALLRELAAQNSGLCVISTRLPVRDLEEHEGSAALRHDLEQLSPEAGARVLEAQGVKGTGEELEKAATDFGGHALALPCWVAICATFAMAISGGGGRSARWRKS